MKVSELITELQEHDPDMDIVLSGYEGGYYEPNRVNTIRLVTNVHSEYYYGPHEDEADNPEYISIPDNRKKTCVFIL